MTALLDTSFLLATAFGKDQHHARAATAMRELKGPRLVAAPVVTELFFMTAARLSYDRALQLFNLLQTSAFELLPT